MITAPLARQHARVGCNSCIPQPPGHSTNTAGAGRGCLGHGRPDLVLHVGGQGRPGLVIAQLFAQATPAGSRILCKQTLSKSKYGGDKSEADSNLLICGLIQADWAHIAGKTNGRSMLPRCGKPANRFHTAKLRMRPISLHI